MSNFTPDKSVLPASVLIFILNLFAESANTRQSAKEENSKTVSIKEIILIVKNLLFIVTPFRITANIISMK